MKFKFLFYLVFFCFQNAFAILDHYRVTTYTTEEGLSHNHIECIYRDSRGFLWTGTWYGLNRFDGYDFITYHKDSTLTSLSNGFVNKIIEDKNGDLWIGTRNGINKFSFKTENFTRFQTNSEINKPINALVFDDKNNLWVGSEADGLECFYLNDALTEVDSIKKYSVDFFDTKGISSQNVYSLLLSSDGFIYIGSVLGLDRLNLSTGEVYKFQDQLNPLYFDATIVHTLFEDKDQTIWVGTEVGLLRIDKNAESIKEYTTDYAHPDNTKALSHGLVKSINQDKNGTILIGTLGGLHLLDKATETFTIFPVNTELEHSLNNQFINEVYCDNVGNVWIGTERGGLNKYNVNQKAFEFVSGYQNRSQDDLKNAIINSIYEDENYLWIGTAGNGLSYIEKKTGKVHQFMTVLNENSLCGNYVSAIQPSKNKGEMWFATWGHGICKGKLLPDGHIHFKTYLYNPTKPLGEPHIYVSDIAFDNQGFLWVSTSDELLLYNQDTDDFVLVEAYQSNGELVNHIGVLKIDTNNNLWIGTTNGLHRIQLDPKWDFEQRIQPHHVFTYLSDENNVHSISGNFIASIFQDDEENLWFSVYGAGLDKLEMLGINENEAIFSHLNKKNGLKTPVVYGIVEDANQNLWLSTDNGVTKYNYKTKNIISYYENDGLRSNQFYWSAYNRTFNDNVYFGSTKGLIYFNPDSIISNKNLPNVVVSKFLLFNQEVLVSDQGKILSKTISETNEITLTHKQNSVTFEFAALSFFSPENNRYKYMLSGFDQNWISCSSDRRFAIYTNLNPGAYQFMVKGSNNDGLWNDKPATILLTIKAPWWRTKLFYFISIIGLMFSVWIFTILYNWNLRRKKIKLERIVKERTKALNEKSQALQNQKIELNNSNLQLQKTNETKDKLFAVIAHDLKSPFNVILGMTEILNTDYDKFSDDEIKKMIDSINSSSKNLFDLLENLLQWAKSQKSSLKPKIKKIDIDQIIQKTINLCSNQASNKHISIVYENHVTGNIMGDPNLFDVVVRNLVNNAIKFTENDTITIRTENDPKKPFAIIYVIDNGVGMDQNQLNGLFDIKTSTSKEGTNGEKGTGLGLLVCKEFVEKNGGTLSVKSSVNSGTTFQFTIPKTTTNELL